ncbi:MAG: methyltransferase domain-containing protein [Gammaproteobacteria bacterium]|nr:methyltransferase domain-containing protein [Gammaproteobacteria bacterium]
MSKPEIERFDDRLSRVYDPKGDKARLYDEWASTYDEDLLNDLGYVAHSEVGAIFTELVADTSTAILDVACGTGLAGQFLRQRGYQRIDGVDFSEGMLDLVRSRDIYQQTWQHDFTKPASIDTLYQALICVGLFSYHVPRVSDMHNVVNCVEPGGLCLISVNGAAWTELGLEPLVYQEADDHEFTIIEIRETGYIRNENINARVLIIQRHP